MTNLNYPMELVDDEWIAFEKAIDQIKQNAAKNAHRRPKMTTLIEEFAEAVLAARGKHDDPLRLEVEQIGGIAVNLLWQIILYGDSEVANLRTTR